jgi:hypothetical protein
MARCTRFLRATALAILAVQIAVCAQATLSACGPTQHMHNGRPAPDCPMHHGHEAPPSQPADDEHHHHHSGPATDAGAHLACGCSSDLPSFLTIDSAVVSFRLSVARPTVTHVASFISATSPLERPTAPRTPPPRL